MPVQAPPAGATRSKRTPRIPRPPGTQQVHRFTDHEMCPSFILHINFPVRVSGQKEGGSLAIVQIEVNNKMCTYDLELDQMDGGSFFLLL